MRKLLITFVSIGAMMAGFYFSAQHFAVALPAANLSVSGSEVGSYRPDFTLATNSGEMVSVDDYAGKTILINFWATWCAPCREEMPILVDLQRSNAANGLQVVGIALDDAKVVNKFVQSFGISYPVLVGESDVFDVSAAYGNTEGVLPYSVLIDSEGIIRWQYAGKLKHDDLTRRLKEFL